MEDFEELYAIHSPTDVFVHIQEFLGDYLVRAFDYRTFCDKVGVTEDISPDDEQAWVKHVTKYLKVDLNVASTVMLRLAVMIAKAYSLQLADWQDINDACGSAVQMVPRCYKLNRTLPGALNDARSLRAMPPAEESLSPWLTEEGKELFERHHACSWADIQALTKNDGDVTARFSGAFIVKEVIRMDAIAMVHMTALRVGEATSDGPAPAKKFEEDDPVLWEVDDQLGELLDVGMVIDGDWYELQSEICFLSELQHVRPKWAL
jgi:hypothetical protein